MLNNPFTFHRESPISEDVIILLRAHHQEMFKHSPPQSIHALDESQFHRSDITFWSVRNRDLLAGCGALKQLDQTHVELKAMRTAPAFIRQGIAKALIKNLLYQAGEQGYHRVSLETGTMDFFAPARALYLASGFEECSPFADYKVDPHSVCMTLAL